MPIYPGDPLTPGVGATAGAKRLTRARGADHPQDPDAADLLRATRRRSSPRCRGPVVTGKQRGGLPIAYHWGGTDAVKVHLAVKSDWSLKPIYDVIAMLRGSRLSRPVDRPRQPPRRLGVRRRPTR